MRILKPMPNPAESADPGLALRIDELFEAVRENQFSLAYQPKIDMRTLQFVSVEALVRWEHPDHGVLHPEMFIPAAEKSGLITDLTSLVMNEAIGQCARWRDGGLDLSVAINVSAVSLEDRNFPDEIRKLTEKHGVSPSQIVLEITESWVSNDQKAAREILTRLRVQEFNLALDDVGTGWASYSQLHDLPYSEMKLDRSHVKEATADEDTRQFIKLCIDLGHELGMRVVAEGIESQKQWDAMAALGCDIGQGFFLARPMSGGDVPEWLTRWNTYLGNATCYRRLTF